MVTYPFDEILLATLAGVVCGADDWEGVEEIATGALDWLRGFLPFAEGVPTAQTFRKVFRLLDAPALQRGFAAWAASTRRAAREVIAVDGAKHLWVGEPYVRIVLNEIVRRVNPAALVPPAMTLPTKWSGS